MYLEGVRVYVWGEKRGEVNARGRKGREKGERYTHHGQSQIHIGHMNLNEMINSCHRLSLYSLPIRCYNKLLDISIIFTKVSLGYQYCF
jgi:hypothetical protein